MTSSTLAGCRRRRSIGWCRLASGGRHTLDTPSRRALIRVPLASMWQACSNPAKRRPCWLATPSGPSALPCSPKVPRPKKPGLPATSPWLRP